jgi:hypothetical protein
MSRPLVTLVFVALTAVVSYAESPQGEWSNADLMSLEKASDGCARAWLSERTYQLQLAGNRVNGIYRNVVRAIPVGAPSFSPKCKFPAPAPNPIATQLRTWAIVGTATGIDRWQVSAEPGVGGGDFTHFKTEEFKTTLQVRAGYLFDGAGDEASPDTLRFRARGLSPTPARDALETTVKRLNIGACLDVMATLAPSHEAAVKYCDVKERLRGFTGPFVALSVDGAAMFDRVDRAFPMASNTWRRQRGVVFSYVEQYEKQQLIGNAILYEDDDKWHIAFLF